MMKKILVATLSLVIIGLFVFLFNPIRTDDRTDLQKFDDRRASLTSVIHEDDIEIFKIAFRKAVADAGYEVKDDFINIWTHMSGFTQYGMGYHILTTNDEYVSFSIDTPNIESASGAITLGIPLVEDGFDTTQIAHELVYYVNEYSIKLDESSIK